jgi:hypothetical protein
MDKENVYIYTMEHYSAIKKNKIMLFAGKWMKPDMNMLSEISQTEIRKLHVLSICDI